MAAMLVSAICANGAAGHPVGSETVRHALRPPCFLSARGVDDITPRSALLQAVGSLVLTTGLLLAPSITAVAATAPAVVPSTPDLVATHPIMGTGLKRGSNGPAVTTWQKDLAATGYQPGPQDGVFGPATAAATIAFQKHVRLAATGTVNEASWQDLLAALDKMPSYSGLDTKDSGTLTLAARHPAMQQFLALGDSSHWVLTLQDDLQQLGQLKAADCTSTFNQATQTALLNWQWAHHLLPTGTTSLATWQDILAGFKLMPSFRGVPVALANLAGEASSGSSTTSTNTQSAVTSSTKTIDGRPVVAVYHMIATAYGPSAKVLAEISESGQPRLPAWVSIAGVGPAFSCRAGRP